MLYEINWVDYKSNWVDYGGYVGCYGDIYVLYLLCYVKGIYELREGYWGGERYECDSVNVFYMGIYVGVWRGFDLK